MGGTDSTYDTDKGIWDISVYKEQSWRKIWKISINVVRNCRFTHICHDRFQWRVSVNKQTNSVVTLNMQKFLSKHTISSKNPSNQTKRQTNKITWMWSICTNRLHDLTVITNTAFVDRECSSFSFAACSASKSAGLSCPVSRMMALWCWYED